jgi:chemotaxis family two-component system response regulator Rcp1
MITAPMAGTNRLLVIEDNPADVVLLRRALATAGLDCHLTVIDDGADAMHFLRNDGSAATPDLAIVDLNLPKHGGFEIIERMTANPQFAAVPVVILSSSFSLRDQAQMVKFRVRRYIVKPAGLDEYMAIGWQIRELLADGRARQPHSGT